MNKHNNPVSGFYAGLTYVFKGFGLITQKGIRPFVVVPLLVNLLVFSGATWLAVTQLDYWMTQLLPSWLNWLEWLLWPMIAVLFFFIIFYTFTLLANLIAAPFNAILAERIENRLNGLAVPAFQSYKTLPSIVARTFRSELSKLWYMAKWLMLVLILSIIFMFIPGMAIIVPILWTLFGAWMLAIEYIDYPMGNHELYFDEELRSLKKYPSHALSFGWLISLMTTIPVLNFLAMPVGVAGATTMWVDKLAADYRTTR